MFYKPKHFIIQELVPKMIYSPESEYKLWWLFDSRLLFTIDALRKRYGKMVMNTWKWGGDSQYRGWRPWNISVGATMSQHKFGRGGDLIPIETPVEEIRQDIIKGDHIDLKFITCIELNVFWLHVDVRNVAKLLTI